MAENMHISLVIELTTVEAQGLAVLCDRLDENVLSQLAWGIGDGVVAVARWIVVLQRIADRLRFAGYPPVYRSGGPA